MCHRMSPLLLSMPCLTCFSDFTILLLTERLACSLENLMRQEYPLVPPVTGAFTYPISALSTPYCCLLLNDSEQQGKEKQNKQKPNFLLHAKSKLYRGDSTNQLERDENQLLKREGKLLMCFRLFG